jgi:hypothetical protein
VVCGVLLSMRQSVIIRFLVAAWLCILCAEYSFGCQCGVEWRGRTAWEVAKLKAEDSPVIFEGTPVRSELDWAVLTARVGELIPSDLSSFKPTDSNYPQMVITFKVNRAYKGEIGPAIQLRTGLGGGDCGARYAPGLEYLVYTAGPDADHLRVSMCSPGGWVDDPEVATDLRYLRKERPTSTDLARIESWAKQEQLRDRNFQESHARYVKAAGRICGTIIRSSPAEEPGGTIAFLSTAGYSPVAPLQAAVNGDGGFCSPDLGPGKYYLYFVLKNDDEVAALYYPGVAEVVKATPIEVNANRTQSNVAFKVSKQNSYTVRGFIFASENVNATQDLFHSGTTVVLIRTDGDSRAWYHEKASFILPKVGYFKFTDVVPGHYIVCIDAPGPGWMTRKVEVAVTTHMKFINIELVRKK